MSGFPWQCCTNPSGNLAIHDGIAALADYFSFHIKLSKWLREEVITDDPIYQWKHLNTDFLKVTEQSQDRIPVSWVPGEQRRVEAPPKLLCRILHGAPHTCTYGLSTPPACSSEVSTWPVSQGYLRDWVMLLMNNCCLGFYYMTTQLKSSKSVMSPGCLAQGCCLYRWIRPRQDLRCAPFTCEHHRAVLVFCNCQMWRKRQSLISF